MTYLTYERDAYVDIDHQDTITQVVGRPVERCMSTSPRIANCSSDVRIFFREITGIPQSGGLPRMHLDTVSDR
jgi:hypothetical protein